MALHVRCDPGRGPDTTLIPTPAPIVTASTSARTLNSSLAGSHSSAARTPSQSEKGTGCGCPPMMSTVPSGSTTLVWKARGKCIGFFAARTCRWIGGLSDWGQLHG